MRRGGLISAPSEVALLGNSRGVGLRPAARGARALQMVDDKSDLGV